MEDNNSPFHSIQRFGMKLSELIGWNGSSAGLRPIAAFIQNKFFITAKALGGPLSFHYISFQLLAPPFRSLRSCRASFIQLISLISFHCLLSSLRSLHSLSLLCWIEFIGFSSCLRSLFGRSHWRPAAHNPPPLQKTREANNPTQPPMEQQSFIKNEWIGLFPWAPTPSISISLSINLPIRKRRLMREKRLIGEGRLMLHGPHLFLQVS